MILDDLNTKTCLVTGAAGFIGSHVAERLRDAGHCRVVALDDLSGGCVGNVPDGVEFFHGSVAHKIAVEEIFSRFQFDYVYHLAAYAAEGLSHFIPRFNYENNLMGSVNLIAESVRRGVKHFVFTSSIAALGHRADNADESVQPCPDDPYGIAKYAVEMELQSAQRMFGLTYTIFRPHNVVGPRQNIGDKYRNVVGIFMNQIMKGEPLTIFGDGTQTRAFSYIDEVAGAIARAPRVGAAQNEIFNIGANAAYTLNDLAAMVIEAMGAPSNYPIRHLDARKEVLHATLRHDKARDVFGDCEHVPILDGLARMAEWAKRIGPQPPTPAPDVEIDINVPPSWRTK